MSKLIVDSVVLEYGTKKVLSNIFIEFEQGKVTSILGRNGTGKSSLMKIIFGTLSIEDKSIRIDEKRIRKPLYQEEGLLAFLPQDNFVPGYLKLKTVLKIYGITPWQIKKDLPVFEILMDNRMRDLAGGERRLAETYVILKRKVKFVLLDEPFSYLMPLHIQKLKELINEEKQNKGIILTDHMYREVNEISDKMYLLQDGKSHSISNESQLIELGYLNKKS